MNIAKMKLDEETKLNFSVHISGTTEAIGEARFIIEGPDYSVMCKADKTADGIMVSIPKMKGILESGVYKSRLEVILDNKVFTPLREEVEFETLIEFRAEMKEAAPLPKEEISIVLKEEPAKPATKPADTPKRTVTKFPKTKPVATTGVSNPAPKKGPMLANEEIELVKFAKILSSLKH